MTSRELNQKIIKEEKLNTRGFLLGSETNSKNDLFDLFRSQTSILNNLSNPPWDLKITQKIISLVLFWDLKLQHAIIILALSWDLTPSILPQDLLN